MISWFQAFAFKWVNLYYRCLEGTPQFRVTAEFMSSGPVVVAVLSKVDAVNAWRELIGPADPNVARDTSPGSLRAQLGVDALLAFFFEAVLSSADEPAKVASHLSSHAPAAWSKWPSWKACTRHHRFLGGRFPLPSCSPLPGGAVEPQSCDLNSPIASRTIPQCVYACVCVPRC